MKPRELILLSPYRLPAQHSLTLADDDMAAWLNGYSALWHPAAAWQASSPPRVDSPYDHEHPRPGHIYAIPESPPSLLPDDWQARLAAAGAVSFTATRDRAATLANLFAALTSVPPVAGKNAGSEPNAPAAEPTPPVQHEREATAHLVTLPAEAVAPFFGLGLGYMLLAALCEAMEHENLLQTADFWADFQRAIAAAAGWPDPVGDAPSEGETAADSWEHAHHAHDGAPSDVPEENAFVAPLDSLVADASGSPLQSAATRLLSARETLYPVTIHLLDIVVVDEQRLTDPWPGALAAGQPGNVIASASVLEKMKAACPERLEQLAAWARTDQADLCGGSYLEREDALLPVESQLWNLRKGLAVTRDLVGADVRVFARRRFGAHPQLLVWLNQFGINKAYLVSLDDSAVPTFNGTVASWADQDGKRLDCFVRKPLAVDSVDAFFNLGHHFFKTTREDHTATLAFLHAKGTAQPWYGDLLELARFGPIAGTWTTFGRYFSEIATGDFMASLAPDDLHYDHLSERTPQETSATGYPPAPPKQTFLSPLPVSGFAGQVRLRRRVDTCWTLAALQRGLAGRNDSQNIDAQLGAIEDDLERAGADAPAADRLAAFAALEQRIAGALADRLLARAQGNQPGYLLLNPCGFTRRLALELDGRGLPIPIGDPVKACQVEGNKLHVVAEVPPLGFAWFPQAGVPGTPQPPARMRLADDRCVRNEYFEAELDLTTGGLRAVRDHKSQMNRLAQRLVFRPGSVMKATKVTTTSSGPALGEIVAEGVLLGPQNQVLAKFRQRFRAWLGRPILDLRVELFPEQPPAGYPWHAYFGAQFAWRDERVALLRSANGIGHVTTHKRPQTPDYLELRFARHSTTIFPGGLPFHQREGGRMVDVILVPPGETAQVFDLAVGLDREQPAQTALGLVTPATVVPTTKGPPHIGAKGWLFHLDASNLVLTSMRPGGRELPREGEQTPDLTDAVTVRLLECGGFNTPAELRCPRNPQRVALLDARGQYVMDGTQSGDAALFHAVPGDLIQLQVQFS